MDASKLVACTFDCYGTLIDWEGGLGAFLYDYALRQRDDRVNGRELRERWEAIQFELIQGEYMRRRESGALTYDLEDAALTDSYRSSQSGWYLQAVYQFTPRWRAGLRYDALDSGTPAIGLVESGALPAEALPALVPGKPARATAMLDWNPSEFSRWRLQYARDDSRDDGDRDEQLQLQYLFGIGAHGAHKY